MFKHSHAIATLEISTKESPNVFRFGYATSRTKKKPLVVYDRFNCFIIDSRKIYNYNNMVARLIEKKCSAIFYNYSFLPLSIPKARKVFEKYAELFSK